MRSPANRRCSASHGKKITTVNSRRCAFGARPSHSRSCVAVTRACSLATAGGISTGGEPTLGPVDLDLVFFGTSGSVPTAQRAPTALLARRGGERLLFDCAEGTQRQMLRSTVGLVELREVFLTHYHADHYLGLPGMLKTFALRGRELDLTVYGPPGLLDLFGALRRIFGKLTYELQL